MSIIVGQDISEFQGQINWPVYKNNSNFVIMKAGEGVGYIDKWFGFNRTQARAQGLPRGFYHFAKPDLGNSPQDEAKFFCALIDGDPIQQGEVLCLDYEVTYHDPVGWCKAWLDYVSKHFNGIKPLIYLNQSLAQEYDWSPIVKAGYGLWIAAYTYDPNDNEAQIGAWPFAAMQQWTDKQQVPGISGNVDGDVFFGDATTFQKYGYQPTIPVISQPAPVDPTVNPSTPPSTPPTPPVTPQTPPQQPILPSQKGFWKIIQEFLSQLWHLFNS